MNNIINVLIFMSIGIAFVWTDTNVTPSEQCSGNSFEDLRERIQIIPCGKTRCKLSKGTNTTVVIKFQLKKRANTIMNVVSATIGDITLPFIGVDQTDACGHVKRADTGEAINCPLEAHQEYVLTHVFPIESFYPTTNLRVRWGLKDGDDFVICFEVPAKIK